MNNYVPIIWLCKLTKFMKIEAYAEAITLISTVHILPKW